MVTTMESLPNEILHHIFSYLSWFDMLISFWSLNIHFDSLVCSTLSINNNRLNSGLVFTRGLSYNKYSTILFPLISNSSFFSSSIRRIHFDGRNSSAYDLCYEWLFSDENILRFPNLTSLILTRCGSMKSIFQGLPYLIEHQLDELTLTFDDQLFQQINYVKRGSTTSSDIDKQFDMIEQVVYQIFSARCNLKSLQLDNIHDVSNGSSYRLFESNSSRPCNSIQYDHQSSFCVTLRRLHIRLYRARFIENLIERLPNIEEMSVECLSSLKFNALRELNLQRLTKSNENWLNKMPKLRYFSLKTFIFSNEEFVHLKWLLNNLNYIEKLQLHLKGSSLIESPNRNIWKSFIDANFIREYCLPDTTSNLIDFNFYICSQCQLSSNDIEQITNSFKIHSFFVSHQWTNVQCLFDPMMPCQHLFSSFTPAHHFSNSQMNYSFIFNWSYINNLTTHPHPSLHLFLEKFIEFSSNTSYIKVHKKYGKTWNESDLFMSSEMLFQLRQYNEIDFPFRNVTKIQFGVNFDRKNAISVKPEDRNPIREKVLAHLISMTVQLKCLVIERFEWLFHAVQYSSNELRTNALNTVQYAEFCLPYSFIGCKATSVSKHFVSFLTTYMSHLQTLRLWRSDDFPWSLARPAYRPGYLYEGPIEPWLMSSSSETSKLIAKHVLIFEQDLYRLMEGLKDLTFLDIYGAVSRKKARAYLLMAQTHFPHSHVRVELTRFRLWL